MPMLTFEDLEKLIAKGENRNLELKKSTGELTAGMHTACAFLQKTPQVCPSTTQVRLEFQDWCLQWARIIWQLRI